MKFLHQLSEFRRRIFSCRIGGFRCIIKAFPVTPVVQYKVTGEFSTIFSCCGCHICGCLRNHLFRSLIKFINRLHFHRRNADFLQIIQFLRNSCKGASVCHLGGSMHGKSTDMHAITYALTIGKHRVFILLPVEILSGKYRNAIAIFSYFSVSRLT